MASGKQNRFSSYRLSRRQLLRLAGATGVGAVASGALRPIGTLAESPPGKGVGQGVLHHYARDTYQSFKAMTFDTGLPADNYCRNPDGSWTASRYTSPTNIGAYIWSTLAAEDLHIITHDESTRRISRTLSTLQGMETSHGFYFNWYDPANGDVLTTWPTDGHTVRPFLSTVDNGWLAAALIVLHNARPGLAAQANSILNGMNFGFFYDAFDPNDPFVHPGQLYFGYYPDTDEYPPGHYGTFNSEPRIASYIGIAMGDIPGDHYYHMARTLPPNYDWQEQIPEGVTRTYFGVDVYEGHYVYNDTRFVPTWGGDMFEALMPVIFVPEAEWAPYSWRINHPIYVQAQIYFGLHQARYGYWGFSPCDVPEGGYKAYGVDAIGMAPDGYPSNNDNTLVDRFSPPPPPSAYTNGVVTPHASFLALPFAPREAIQNLQNIAKDFDAYGELGFQDSVNVDSGVVSNCVLALDQGMIMGAISNALLNRRTQRYFSKGMVEAKIRPLISPEHFTAGRGA